MGNDIRQVLHAIQMWRAQSNTMKYGDLKDGGMQRIEKDKVRYNDTVQLLCTTFFRYQTFSVPPSIRLQLLQQLPLLPQLNHVTNASINSYSSPSSRRYSVSHLLTHVYSCWVGQKHLWRNDTTRILWTTPSYHCSCR